MPRWKLLSGVHTDKDAKPVKLVDVPGIERDPENPDCYYAGDIFDSDKNLSKFNYRDRDDNPIQIRFEQVDESASDELDSMTIAQLRELADAEGIELPADLKKPQIVAAVRAALAYRQAVA